MGQNCIGLPGLDVSGKSPPVTFVLPSDRGNMQRQQISVIGLTKRPSQAASAAAMWLFSFLTAGWLYKVSYLLSMLGFVLFFGPQALRSIRAWIRREQWKRKNRR